MVKEETLELYNCTLKGVAQELQIIKDLVDGYLKLDKLEEAELVSLAIGLADVGNSILDLQHKLTKQGCFKDEN